MDNKKTRLWSIKFILVIIASTGISFGTYLYLSTLPLYAERISGSTTWAGLMTGAYAISALVSRPITGYLIDRYPRRVIAIIGAGICLAACVLYNFTNAIYMLLIFRALHGFGFGIHTTAASTIAVDLIPESRRMEGLGHYGIFMTISSAVAPAIALPLIENASNGLMQITLVAICLMACTFLALAFLGNRRAENSINSDSIAEENPKTEKRFVKQAIKPGIIMFLVSMIQGGIVSFLALYAKDNGFGEIGLFFTCSAAGIVLSRLFAGKIGDKYGPRAIMIPALALMMVSVFGIYMAGSARAVIILGIPFGIALGSITPTMQASIINMYPRRRRGAANGLVYACIDVGLGVGSMVWGFVVSITYYGSIYLISFVVCALILLWVLFGKWTYSTK